jgi:crotonobetainyl-CoA:carnitine CoA-transferase CaiB-like acyl-CoA transferase
MNDPTKTFPGLLEGLRVLELAGANNDYCGLLLAGMGADVVKIEPPLGAASRSSAPFAGDVPGAERSLVFWAYNRDKRSALLDLGTGDGRAALLHLLEDTDILL